jgi:phosphoglucosamine mutase
VRYKDGEPLNSARVHEAIEAARADLGNSGRILVRKSGTEKLIRVMGEGDDETIVHRAVDQIVETVKEVAA